MTIAIFILLALNCFATVGVIFMLRDKPQHKEPEETEPDKEFLRMKSQYENFMNYGGSGRGQKEIEN